MKVVKRNGSIQDFSINKIILTLERVSDDINEPFTESDMENLSIGIERDLKTLECEKVSSSDLYEIVIDELRKFGFSKAAKYYKEFEKDY